MSGAQDAKICPSNKDDYTKITFCPDLPKFGMTSLDRDTVALLTRRIYDLAGCLSGVKVYLNEKRIPVGDDSSSIQIRSNLLLHARLCDSLVIIQNKVTFIHTGHVNLGYVCKFKYTLI